jgi:hypothetical protein
LAPLEYLEREVFLHDPISGSVGRAWKKEMRVKKRQVPGSFGNLQVVRAYD